MKESVGSANKLKSLLTALRKKYKAAEPPAGLDPLEVLTLGILRRNATLAEGLEGLRRLHEEFVDFNEMRVAPPKDIVDVLQKSMPDSRLKAEQLTTTLNRMFDHGIALDLKSLAGLGKRELKEQLRSNLQLDEYGEAYLMNYVFESPVLPVDDRLATKLKEEGYIAADATSARIREVLEQAVPVRSRHEAFELLSQFAAEPISAKRKKADAEEAARARKAAKPPKAAGAPRKRPAAQKKKP
jgi:endonuclease III